MKQLLTLTLLGLLSLHAQTSSTTAHPSVKIDSSEMHLAMKIRHDYEQFIDTRPSTEKQYLAQQVKSDIETFEATFPNSPLMPETLALLREVDIYLDAKH